MNNVRMTDRTYETVCEFVRVRLAAWRDLPRARHRLSKFLQDAGRTTRARAA